MAGSPTERTLRELRRRGFLAAVVEKWNAFSSVRVDLFGFADVIAVKPGEGVLLVQTTSTGNVSARIRKMLPIESVLICLQAGVAVQVWGWAKRGPRGKVKRWTLSVTVLGVRDGTVVVTD